MADKLVAGAGLDCDYAAIETRTLVEAEEALAPALHHPIRRRLLELMRAYRPAAIAHFDSLEGEKKKKEG